MSDALNAVYGAIDEQHSEESAATRRRFVAGGAAALAGMGLLAVPQMASAAHLPGEMVTNGRFALRDTKNSNPQRILNIAATAEVLATILNTLGSVGSRAVDGTRVGPLALPMNGNQVIAASAVQELGHYQTLVAFGAKAATFKIWIPDAFVSDPITFLRVIEVGDQIFVNAYLIATTTYGNLGNGDVARAAAEFCGVEAVHRAFARHLRGVPGNDRMFLKYEQEEQAVDALDRGQRGFQSIETAPKRLQQAGFGFGAKGKEPGRFYDFATVAKDTPNPGFVNTRDPD